LPPCRTVNLLYPITAEEAICHFLDACKISRLCEEHIYPALAADGVEGTGGNVEMSTDIIDIVEATGNGEERRHP
jgi:hypothetical protein